MTRPVSYFIGTQYTNMNMLRLSVRELQARTGRTDGQTNGKADGNAKYGILV